MGFDTRTSQGFEGELEREAPLLAEETLVRSPSQLPVAVAKSTRIARSALSLCRVPLDNQIG
jgi:hypothetical protein